MKTRLAHEPHLLIRDCALPPGGEWEPQTSGWWLIQIRSGSAYWLHAGMNQELPTGSVLVEANLVSGRIRASQLGGASLHFFRIETELLTGLATLGEQHFFESAAVRRSNLPLILAPEDPVAVRFKELYAGRNGNDLSQRLQLVQLFIQVFGKTLYEGGAGQAAPVEARERLLDFLRQTPASELLNMSFSDLVEVMNCTPRHLSRVFHELVGMSFREKQAKIRLTRARELLATTESKVVDVALESGYQSLSLFNLMFRKRFGMSPGKWRLKLQNDNHRITRRRKVAHLV
jgi:AraC-like DNA-binding protein